MESVSNSPSVVKAINPKSFWHLCILSFIFFSLLRYTTFFLEANVRLLVFVMLVGGVEPMTSTLLL